ncbi:MAG: hypothetical protein MJA30_00520 [Cytophagales bacterium]|nr:hypothetical protein [Cytophagales bacterium]
MRQAFTFITLLGTVFFLACDDDDNQLNELQPITGEATNIDNFSLTISGQVNILEGEVIDHGFGIRLKGDTKEGYVGFARLDPSGKVSTEIIGRTPGETYEFRIFAATENKIYYGEYVEFTMQDDLSNDDFSFSPSIGTLGTPITIVGPGIWEEFGHIPFDFVFELPGDQSRSVQFWESREPDTIIIETPRITFTDNQYDAHNTTFKLVIGSNTYTLGKFQFTHSFYVSRELEYTYDPDPIRTIEVLTDNARKDNVFKVAGIEVENNPVWVSDDVYANTLTIPLSLDFGWYSVTVTSASGNPLSVKPNKSDTFSVH